MAKIRETKQDELKKWIATRPPAIQELCKKLPPDRLYKMKSTGHRVTLYSYSENGTVTVIVSGEFNAVIFPRKVFGINPDDLEECDLPGDNEPTGAMLTDRKEIEEFIKSNLSPQLRKEL